MTRAAALALAACTGRAPIATCDDDLRGVYVGDGERWMVIDRGATLEAYPLLPDVTVPEVLRTEPGAPTPPGAPPRVDIAPRALALVRTPDTATHPPDEASGGTSRGTRGGSIAGELRRRYMQGAARCDARGAVSVTRCARDALELVVVEPSPPLGFAPCVWPTPAPARVVRWRRAD